MDRIAIFGDSIVAGIGDPVHGGWVGHVKGFMKMQRPGTRVFNFGVPGDDSSGLLARIEPQCLASSPNRIVISIGINDTCYGPDPSRVDSLRFSLNIERIAAMALLAARRVVFAGLTRVDEGRTMPISRKPLQNFENELILAHDAALQTVCRSRGLTYVPLFDLLSSADLADGLHPNAEGHRKIFERMKNYL